MTVTEFWESEPIDVFVFLEVRSKAMREREQQEWDYVRHIMVGSMQPYSERPLKYTDIMRLDRDGKHIPELTPYEKQELARWSARCDQEMIDSGATLVDWHGNPIK